MKKSICLWILAVSLVFGVEIHWAKDYESALIHAKDINKPVLMLVDRINCPYCELLKEDVLSDSSIIDFINKNFIPVHVLQNDGTYPQDIYSVLGTPTTFFISPEGKKSFNPIIGYVKKDKYLRYLGMGLKQR